MQHLFSPEGERALKAVMLLEPVLAFDFDGTLAPIVARPDEATVPIAVSLCLERLAQRFTVAIVSGRSVADVVPRLGFAAQHVIGNHGAEERVEDAGGTAPHGVEARADDARSRALRGARGLVEGARSAAPHPALDVVRARIGEQASALRRAGVTVEDKGLSLALHYRLAPDAGAALVAIESLLEGTPPALQRLGGKRVVNVVVVGLPDKGDAVAGLVRRVGAIAAVFVGDDVNDESVFVRAEPDWLTVRIGREDPHSKAMFFLDSEAELAVMLEKILALA